MILWRPRLLFSLTIMVIYSFIGLPTQTPQKVAPYPSSSNPKSILFHLKKSLNLNNKQHRKTAKSGEKRVDCLGTQESGGDMTMSFWASLTASRISRSGQPRSLQLWTTSENRQRSSQRNLLSLTKGPRYTKQTPTGQRHPPHPPIPPRA